MTNKHQKCHFNIEEKKPMTDEEIFRKEVTRFLAKSIKKCKKIDNPITLALNVGYALGRYFNAMDFVKFTNTFLYMEAFKLTKDLRDELIQIANSIH